MKAFREVGRVTLLVGIFVLCSCAAPQQPEKKPQVPTRPEVVSKAEEVRTVKAADRMSEAAKTAGFIALSETKMSWFEAENFCTQQGGRVPRIKDTLYASPYHDFVIEGFGKAGRSWVEVGVPEGEYWTSNLGDYRNTAWVVSGRTRVTFIEYNHLYPVRVACVR